MTLELRLLPAMFAVCRLPPDAPSPERFWSLTRTDALTGVAAAPTTPLAEAEVSVLPIAAYDTDYLFMREETLARAVAALEAAGHRVGTDS